MTTTQYSLKPLQLSVQVKQDTQRLVALQRSFADLTTELVNKDIDTIQSQTGKIEGFAKGITSVISKVGSYKSQCTKTITQLEKQVDQLNGKIKFYQREFKNNNKENEYRKQIDTNEKKYLAEWQKRIQMAGKIQTDVLSKVEIEDRKSKANQVFKWIIVTIYNQPEAKFYWPNFKEQIFIRDQGKDFKERLGKVNASNARQQQRVKTADFLKTYNEIIACKELKKAQKQVEDIKKIAQIFLNCFQISKQIRTLQTQIEKSRQQCREKDEQAMRWKARTQALYDRIKSNKQYLAILTKVDSLLNGKIQNYTEKQTTAKDIVQKLKQNGTISHLEIDVGDQKRDNCECTIF